MRVLVVTDQMLRVDEDVCYCTENLFDILKRFSLLGKISICATENNGKLSNTIGTDLSNIVSLRDITFLKKTYLKTDANSYRSLENAVKESDLVIGYIPSINACSACGLAKKYSKRYMSYVVGCIWDALWNHSFVGKSLALYNYFRARKTLKMSDYALYVTDQFLQKRYPCKGITCGCSDVRIPCLDSNVLNKRLSLLTGIDDTSDIHIATIANNSVRYKGQHFVIKALARMKKEGFTKYHYHLIGGGDKSRLEKLAKKLGVDANVHFEGIVPHSHIFEKLDQMHIYIQPSLQEGLPRSVVEAMSRGLLCICANTAAMPEMILPKYIVKKKSVKQICTVLKQISLNELIEQAKRNFDESANYLESVLDKKRNLFFESVKEDCMRKNV